MMTIKKKLKDFPRSVAYYQLKTGEIINVLTLFYFGGSLSCALKGEIIKEAFADFNII
jgi:hypothetical protein